MIVFRGLSTLSMVPEAFRDGAGGHADRWGRAAPVEAWCRASTILLLRRQDGVPAARSDVLPAGRKIDSSIDGRPAGIRLISRAAATPTLRAYRSSVTLTGITSRPPALAAGRVRDDCHAFAMRFCLAAAYWVVAAGRLLLSAGLIRARDATLALRWSCWLSERGMHHWQKPRSGEGG
jgi:hypothetical protein